MAQTTLKRATAMKRHGLRKTFYETIEPYLFLLPALAIFGIFLYYPFFKTIYLSTYLTNAQGLPKLFVGIRNFNTIFTSPSFWNSLGVTFQFVGMVALGGLLVGLCTSLMTVGKFPGRTFASAIYAMPISIASAAAAMAFKMILHPSIGLLNYVLGTKNTWASDPVWALPIMAILTIWLVSGINFIFIGAGLRNIPDDLYESAAIDGAGYWRKFRHITIPCLSPTLFFQIIINIISAFQSFTQIRLITQGGPNEATNVIVYAIYRDAFFNYRFGEAAARSIILFLIILIITLIQFSMEKRSVHY